MIDLEGQEKILVSIGNILEKKIFIYAIGGTAMMFCNLKDATLDVDLVFDRKSDREEMISALRKIKAKELDVTLVYGQKENTPYVMKLDNVRFDLFMNKIITSVFSEQMKGRAKQIHEFGRNLIINVADAQDILLLKAVTLRRKDEDDIAIIIKSSMVNWDIIIKEAENQIISGNERAVLDLGTTLEKIKKLGTAEIPNEVLDKLWDLMKEQIKKKSREAK
ncbi:hypothetical protein HYW75_05590 [Candidatus Pacearchaeota archaeon]|nr:hypothetical protein [Candidatus Pacearchaeota archaeon]